MKFLTGRPLAEFSNNNVPFSKKMPRVVPSESDMGHGATSDVYCCIVIL